MRSHEIRLIKIKKWITNAFSKIMKGLSAISNMDYVIIKFQISRRF